MKVCFAILCFGVLIAVSACAADDMKISDVKLLPDSSPVSLSAKVVTYASTGFFYIEEYTRAMGIRVEIPGHGLTVGMKADVTGTMQTNSNKERYILSDSAVQTAPPNDAGTIVPVGMNNSAIGGDAWRVEGTGGQQGAAGSLGLNNIGLLVKTWGKFRKINDTTFSIDDGAGLFLQCTVPAGTYLHPDWDYVSITGISSLFKYNSVIYPSSILVRDIDVMLTVEVVSTPGKPLGNENTVLDRVEEFLTAGSTCSQGHDVEYSFNWGDGTSSPWSTSTSASRSWGTVGEKTVTVTARCQTHNSITATSDVLQVNVDGYTGEMIFVSSGSFLMGNNGSEPYSRADELPQHSVYLSDYYIGKYEVTRGEYRRFVEAGGYSNSSYWSAEGWSWKVSNNMTEPAYWAVVQDWKYPYNDGIGTFSQTDNHPVVGVTYHEAEAFCAWAGGHLPTEAQWEKAARWTGSYPNVWPWGNTWDAEKCNNELDTLYPVIQTNPVGSYPSGASPYGCQDMAGNVYEWCKDWYGSYYYTGGWSDPPGPSSGTSRVVRGASWTGRDSLCRCAFRLYYSPHSRWSDQGFRLAR